MSAQTSSQNDSFAISLRKIVDNTALISGGGGGPGGPATWGNITGTLSNQTDLQNALDALQSANTRNVSFSDLIANNPLVVPIRGFQNNYADYGSGQLPTQTYFSAGNVIYQGTVKKTSGDIAYDDVLFDLPNLYELYNSGLQPVSIFDNTFKPVTGSMNPSDTASPVPNAKIKYPGTITNFEFTVFTCLFQSAGRFGGGIYQQFGSGATLDDVSVVFPQPFPNNQTGLKVCMYFHGTGDDYVSHLSSPVSATSTQRLFRDSLLALLVDGWTVIASSGGAIPTSWGNPSSWTATQNALNWLKSTFNVSKLVVLGQSMGGLTSMRACAQYPGISRFYGIYPVLNLAYSYNASPAFNTSINTAYGTSDQAGFDAASVGCDPLVFPLGQFAGKSFRMTASPDDTIVSKVNNSDAFATRVTGTAASVTVVTVSGDHGDPSAFIPSDIVAFLDS